MQYINSLRGEPMKIKLNISKDLKRNLKIKAKERELERNDFIYEIIFNLLKEKEAVWLPKIDNVLDVANKEELTVEEKARKDMKKTTKNLQPLILNVDEKTFFALAIIAKKLKKSKEEMLINILTEITR
jgi:hypothetical protein